MAKHILIVPSMACPAACSYCFGPHSGGPRMEQVTLAQTARWVESQSKPEALEVTFHGGEPLTAGAAFFREALPMLSSAWQGRAVRFTVQSNLWNLSDELLDLFASYPVSIGTSLDGPEALNDAQRGAEYFRRTMHGIEQARARGIPVGCIATFTAQSAGRWREAADFFLGEGLGFSIHAALPVLGRPAGQAWVLAPAAYGDLMEDLLDFYLENLSRTRIASLDAVIRSVASGKGGMCTFGDCLGSYLAVGPDGAVYPCQRFTGDARFRLGDVAAPVEALRRSETWQAFEQRQAHIHAACGGCAFLDICRGGCPYNVLAAGETGRFNGRVRDPYCQAYQRIFQKITDLAAAEVFSADNLSAVVDAVDAKRGALRKGRVLELMSNQPHPFETAQNARQALAAVALAASASPLEGARKLVRAGVTAQEERARLGLELLQKRLSAHTKAMNNLYLHVTFACPSRCTHCYAEGGAARKGAYPAERVADLAREAARAGFRHLVITGGEPLVHPQVTDMLRQVGEAKQAVRPLRFVLRTSLACPVDDELLALTANGLDEVVVSLDGDRQTHDSRRGSGSYDAALVHLRRLLALNGSAEISLAAVLPVEQAQGPAGRHVRALADELGIRRVRMRPLLPLGRAAHSLPDLQAEVVWAHLQPAERVAYGFTPAASCGMGQNLYVEPDGEVYPCYAWHGAAWEMGNVLVGDGLAGVMASEAFRRLGRANVDSNAGCQACALRYLCGGACRAWNRLPENRQVDLDAAPMDCARLRVRAQSVLRSALAHLEISEERWLSAGLPLN